MIRALHFIRHNKITSLFYILVAARFFYPFWNNPIPHQVGLSGRQWRQADRFWEPQFMSGVDSFLYQFWLHIVRALDGGSEWVVQSASGLLCLLMPLGWYWCAKRLLPHSWALAFGIAMAIIPSFLTIYAYFAAETLMLVLMGFAAWQTSKAFQEPKWQTASLASILWMMAALTRFAAIVPAVACLVVLIVVLPNWRKRLLSLALYAAVVLPMLGFSAWHSHKSIGLYAVFGMPEMNAVLTRARASRLYIESDMTDKKRKWFRSPGYFSKPLEPLHPWRMRNLNPPVTISIMRENGREDWDAAMERFPLTRDVFLNQMRDNIIMLLFAPSWPEYWPELWHNSSQTIKWEGNINKYYRFMWCPIILFVIFLAPFYRGPALQQQLIMLTLAMLGVFMIQTTSVFEGRYRKPVEPLLLLSACIIYQHSREKRHGHS